MEVTLYINTDAQCKELLLSDSHGKYVVRGETEMGRLNLSETYKLSAG